MSATTDTTYDSRGDKINTLAAIRAVINADASGAWVSMLIQGDSRRVRDHSARVLGTGEVPTMGDFTRSLWDGDIDRASHHADAVNRAAMADAGLLD